MRINLDGSNGHIIIALLMVAGGIVLNAFSVPTTAAAMGGTVFGWGMKWLGDSMKKTNDGNGHG